MKILVLNGSPRKKGNTAAHLEAFRTGAEEKGHEVCILPVGSLKIAGCMACEYCHGKGNGTCVIKDDMELVIPEIESADMIVFASPIYYYGFSGQMQNLLSRFYSFYLPEAGKKYALITSSIDQGASAAAEKQYELMLDYFKGENAGIFTAAGEENQSPEFMKRMAEFGRSL